MRNTLAIAQKELRSYFASPIGYIVIGFFALLYGWFYITMLNYFVRQSMQMAQFGGGPRGDERQPGHDPAAAAERHDPAALPDADGHDAVLCGGEAIGHDRAAADVAAEGSRNHPRQVPRGAGALGGGARGQPHPHRPAVRLRNTGMEADRHGLSGPAS